ncbi:Fur family transcriptional regulator [Paludibacter sp. 221]|uniref:Fur family transcriptional regulator n=1 Tax=Paludibacter sp. 221 TaxID=2302939 RepID=UPI00351B99C6
MQAQQHLLKYSIKPSVQRIAVMNFLLNNKIHPTVDEIYISLSPSIPTLSKTTIYNTLNLFAEKGAVRVLSIDEKNARYDVDISAHAHFICKGCGKVHDLTDINPDIFKIPEIKGFSFDSAEISYRGTCSNCMN